MPVPFKVKAVYEYKSDEPDDLTFGNGQIITVVEDDDEDWYTGEYVDASGQKRDGIFPRNFVEKYEPAIPSRPARGTRKSVLPETLPGFESAQIQPTVETATSPPQPVKEAEIEPPREFEAAEKPKPQPTVQRGPSVRVSSQTSETKAPAAKAPPPVVADKPSSNSFRDRIAAFNKPAAAPIAPFKPSGNAPSSFIKKPFVAPPPSRDAYVPPPTQPTPQKVYRREEDPSMVRDEEEEVSTNDTFRQEAASSEDQPKPTSLKDRIALLQQQQLEQAQRNAEKKKVKKPATKRLESTEDVNAVTESTEAPLARVGTSETTGRKSLHDEHDNSYDRTDHGASREELVPGTSVPLPPRELVSDTNDADDSGAGDTEDAREEYVDDRRSKAESIKAASIKSPISPVQAAGVEENEEEEDEETEEEEDPDARRRRELRERMAKMSGGMGMMGMFGPPGGAPAPSKKPRAQREAEVQPAETETRDEMARAPPVPIMALPGISARPQPQDSDVTDDHETARQVAATQSPIDGDDYVNQQPSRRSTERSGPVSPSERSIPPLPTRENRARPPPPPSAPAVPRATTSPTARAVPPPPPPTGLAEEPDEMSPLGPPGRTSIDRQSSMRRDVQENRSSTLDRSIPDLSTEGYTPPSDKRASRPPPPIPGFSPTSPQTRAPPPPPPGQPPVHRETSGSREMPTSQFEDDSDEEVTEYDGDYDTDIASSAKHKDALRSHNRDSSMDDEGTLTDDAPRPATNAPLARAVPPLPSTTAPRDMPPPLPSTAPRSQKSMDVPRAAPPPVPPPAAMGEHDDDYDPYRYNAPQHGMPSPPVASPQSPPFHSPAREREEEDMYSAPSQPPPRQPPPPPAVAMPVERAVPPPPPSIPPSTPLQGPSLSAAPEYPKQSLDVGRAPTVRRSMEQSRPNADHGFIASDIDLAEASLWWTHENTAPPTLQARPDVLFEMESNTATKRGGKTTISRDVYVLYMDYSQSTINASFDPADPSQAALSQSHQRPPPPPRQDQLESASGQFGVQLARAASSASGNTIGDGSPFSFVHEILRPLSAAAIMPIGMRSYGALVYANLANASTQQFDEIRAGDIITFRNAKFAGHRGGLHQKYSMDVGKPDHVGIVIDWDGTKKKIRVWEQGREEIEKGKGKKGKVKDESFRMGDLKSGEVKVWRVMSRGWVGWDKS